MEQIRSENKMNERIRELAKQARAEVRADWDKENKIPYPEAHYVFQRDNDQRFAQLIVQECIQLLWTEDCHVSDLAVEEYNRNTNKIKQHFGVE
jgi:hypothetical protein